MTESIIYNLPEEVRPEHIERYVVPMNSDGSLHLDNLRFRAHQGSENIDFAYYADALDEIISYSSGVEHLWEINLKTDSSGNAIWDWYVDGVFQKTFNQGPSYMYDTGNKYVVLGDRGALSVENIGTYGYFRNFKIGTTRGASDLLNDDLSTVPSQIKGWTTVFNRWDDNGIGFEPVSILGNNYTKYTMVVPSTTPFSNGAIATFSGFVSSDFWVTFYLYTDATLSNLMDLSLGMIYIGSNDVLSGTDFPGSLNWIGGTPSGGSAPGNDNNSPFTGNILSANATSSAAYVTKNIAGSPTVWSVEIDFSIPDSVFNALAAQNFTSDLLQVRDNSNSDGLFITANHTDGTSDKFSSLEKHYWTDHSSSNPVGNYDNSVSSTIRGTSDGSTLTWSVDGVTIASYADPLIGGLQHLDVGGIPGGPNDGRYYIKAVRVGTTPGGSDLFSDDFSSGNLSAWDSTTGSCSVISAP